MTEEGTHRPPPSKCCRPKTSVRTASSPLPRYRTFWQLCRHPTHWWGSSGPYGGFPNDQTEYAELQLKKNRPPRTADKNKGKASHTPPDPFEGGVCDAFPLFLWEMDAMTLSKKPERLSKRSPAVARMADRTAPAKTGTSPLNGPIMRHTEPFSALWKLLPVLHFYFRLCDPTLQLTENKRWIARIVNRLIYWKTNFVGDHGTWVKCGPGLQLWSAFTRTSAGPHFTNGQWN